MKISRIGELRDAILCSGGVAKLVAGPLLLIECFKINASDAARRSLKTSFDDFAVKPDGFKNLRTLVGLEG